MPIPVIRVAWSRRPDPKGPETTDLQGFYPYIFSFTDGIPITALVQNIAVKDTTSSWQRKLFESNVYMTKVEVWKEKYKDVYYIYAEPDKEIKKQLS